MEFILIASVGGIVFAVFMAWTAWSERGERNRTSHEGSRTSVGRDW